MFRLKRNALFWWSLALTLLVTAAATAFDCLSIEGDLSLCALETRSLAGAPYAQLAAAAVIVLFIGADNSGTIRNKIFVGSPRGGVYAANLLTGVVIGCSINAAWLVGGLSGAPILGFWRMSFAEAAWLIAVSFVTTAAVSVLSAIVGMLIPRRSAAAVAAMGGAIALMIAAGTVYSRLEQPKETMTAEPADGELVFEVKENPLYIDGLKRAVYEAALHINPLAPAVTLSNCDLTNTAADVAGTAFVAVFAGSLGAAAFGRRDIK